MMGAAGLKGPGIAAAVMRQRLVAVPRSTRSISTFRMQRMRFPGQRAQFTPAFSGVTPWVAPAAVGPAAIRFNSTSSDAVSAPAGETSGSGTPPPFDELSSLDIAAIPEQIGYLKQLGLDYGWGVSTTMQWLIEHIHIWSGLPWWASIVTLGIAVRFALLKPMLNASDTSAKMHNIKDQTSPRRAEMMAAMQKNDQMLAQQKRAELDKLNHVHGIKVSRTFIPMLQIPLGFGMFRVIRGMASLPVPAMLNESIFWLNDLTVRDPYFILPAMTALFMFSSLKRGGEAGLTDIMSGGAGRLLMYFLPGISFLCMGWMPSALQLYFVSTGAFAAVQAHMIHSYKFRKWMNMTQPRRVKGKADKPAPKGDLETRLREHRRRAAGFPPLPQQQPTQEPRDVSAIDRFAGSFKDSLKDAKDRFVPKKEHRRLSEQELKEAEAEDAEAKKAEAHARKQRNWELAEAWEQSQGKKNMDWREAQWQEMERARARAKARQ